MIEMEQLRFAIRGSYPRSPELRQKRRNCEEGGGDYGRVDLAMREPVRVLNEHLRIATFSSCEAHPCEADRRYYDTFRYRHDDFCPYRSPYRSYIGLELGGFGEALHLVDFLRLLGFTPGPCTPLPEKKERPGAPDVARVRVSYDLSAGFPAGILSFSYRYYGIGRDIDGRCLIEVKVPPGRPIRAWREWDEARDRGWEYWLELLRLFTRYETHALSE